MASPADPWGQAAVVQDTPQGDDWGAGTPVNENDLPSTFSPDHAHEAIRSIAPGATITSTARTPARNAAVGGVPDSMHLDDNAADIVLPKGITPAQFRSHLEGQGYPVTEFLDEKDHVHWGWGAKGKQQTASQDPWGAGKPVSTLPAEGAVPGKVFLNPSLAPKVPAGSPRPFAPGEFVQNPDGTWSSEISVTVKNPALNRGRATLLPSLWLVDGKPVRVSEDQAVEFANKSGISWPSYPSLKAAEDASTTRESQWQKFKDPRAASVVRPLWDAPNDGHFHRTKQENADLDAFFAEAKKAAPTFQPDWSVEKAARAKSFYGSAWEVLKGAVKTTPARWKQMAAGAIQYLGEHPDVMAPDSPVPLTQQEQDHYNEKLAPAREAAGAELADFGHGVYQRAEADLKANMPDLSGSRAKQIAFQVASGTIDILPVIAATATTRSPVPGGAIIAAQAGASKYGQAREAGRDVGAASMDAAFTGLVNGTLGVLPLGVLMKPGQTFLGKTLQSTGTFGAISVAGEAIQLGYDKGLVTPDMTLKDAWGRLVEAGIVGTLQGALLGAGHAGLESAVNRLHARTARENSAIDAYMATRDRQLRGEPEPAPPVTPPEPPARPGAPQPVTAEPAAAPAEASVVPGTEPNSPMGQKMASVAADVRQALGLDRPGRAPEVDPWGPGKPADIAEPVIQTPGVTDVGGEGIPRRALEADVAVTSSGRQVPVQYAVVEAEHLVPSQTQEGNPNDAYPAELQPRDRTRAVSQAQIASIAQNINPRLLDRSPNASDGAPIVAPSGVVESGNGRTLAIQRAYGQNMPSARAYKAYLAEQGYPVEGMKAPVLVRVRSDSMGAEDRQAFVREANQSGQLGYSATERAMSDAAAMPDYALEMYRGGDVESAANREFVRGFMAHALSPNEHAGMVGPDGTLSQEAIRRVRAALLAKAYGDPDLVGAVVESQDGNVKAIGGALTDAAGDWSKMRAGVAKGEIPPNLEQTHLLLAAVKLVDRARADGRNVAEFVSQKDIFSGEALDPGVEGWLRMMFRDTDNWTRPVGRDKLAESLKFYAQEASKAQVGNNLLGEAPVSAADILKVAKAKQYGGESSGSGPSLSFSEDAGTRGEVGDRSGVQGDEAARGAGIAPSGDRPLAPGAIKGQFGPQPKDFVLRPAMPSQPLDLVTEAGDFMRRAGVDLNDRIASTEALANWAYQRGKQFGFESMAAIDNGGIMAAGTNGRPEAVTIPPSIQERMKDPASQVVTIHNHPSSGSFSSGDLATLAAAGHAGMVVVGHDGEWHVASLAARLTAGQNGVTWRTVQDTIKQTQERARAHAVSFTDALYNKRLITGDEGNAMVNHMAMQALVDAGLIHYMGPNKTPVRLQEGMNRVIASIAKAARDLLTENPHFGVVLADNVHRSARPLQLADGLAQVLERAGRPSKSAGGAVGKEAGAGRPGVYVKPEQLRLLEDERRYTETPAFKTWFGESKIVDEAGKPERMFRGDYRDVGPKFKKGITTSARFYFTNDPRVASNYAEGKYYADDNASDYINWFKFPPPKGQRKPVNLEDAWRYLDPAQRERVKDTFLRARKDDDGNIEFSDKQDGGIAGVSHWDYEVAQARGNWLKAANEVWLSSGALFGDEGDFSKILNRAGLKHEYDNPQEGRPVVTPVYLSVKNPVSTRAITPEFINRIANEVKNTRERTASWANNWDKAGVTSKEWVQNLRDDFAAKGGAVADLTDSHVWTSMPENVTKALQRMGYDGVDDRGGKAAGPAGVLSPGQDQHRVVIAFEPEQIKSAIGNRGTFDPTDPNILREDENRYEETRPPFYSQLTRSIEDLKLNRAPAKDWLGVIDNLKTKGVKSEEIDWSGVKDWLQSQTGPVSKADVLQHLKENEVQVQEVQLGTPTEPPAIAKMRDRFQELNDKADAIEKNGGELTRAEYDEMQNLSDELFDHPNPWLSDRNKSQFGQYTLPGGKDYRELLLTLPGKPDNIKELAYRANQTGDIKDIRALEAAKAARANSQFKSGHFDEPNVLAHVRFDDREVPTYTSPQIEDIGVRISKSLGVEPKHLGSGAPMAAAGRGAITKREAAQYNHAKGYSGVPTDGAVEKILHVAEIQSDWHQKGRKQGYAGSENTDGWTAKEGSGDPASGPVWEVRNNNGRWVLGVPREAARTPEEAIARAASKQSNNVPDAPFKTSWHELALKRILRYASEHGYDRLSWDTGETQAARYDLSRQIKSLTYRKNTDGTYEVMAEHIGGRAQYSKLGDKIPAEKLPDYVGKDVADKIILDHGQRGNKDWRELHGLDLKVGGEGMKGFYDKILPAFLNKYAKRWGAKVERTIIGQSDPKTSRMANVIEHHGMSQAEWNRISVAERMRLATEYQKAIGSHDIPVHSLPITPEMRKSVMQGQALFEDKPRYETEPGALDGRGKAVDQTIMPGAEPSATQLAKAREASAGGKMATKVQQKAPGGLFGAQGIPGDDQLSLFQDENRYQDLPKEDRDVLEKAARTGDWIGRFQAKGNSPDATIRSAIAGAFQAWRRIATSVPISVRNIFSRVGEEGAPTEFSDIPTGRPTEAFTAKVKKVVDKVMDLGGDALMNIAPMSQGTPESRAVAKDFANMMRLARWHGNRMMEGLKKNFDHTQLRKMWEAADEESVLLQTKQPTAGRGLATLTPEERRAVQEQQTDAQNVWNAAKANGMVEGEGLPSYVPRMMVEMAGGEVQRLGSSGDTRSIPGIGRNVKTSTPQMKHRKYLTTGETEQAASTKFETLAHVVRDIRTLPMATMRLREAVAGRALINKIKEIGQKTGDETVVEGHEPAGTPFKWFTLDNPAFKTWRPKLVKNEETGKYEPATDQNGDMVFEKVPLYVRGDFEGPLRAVLSTDSSKVYQAAMNMKGRAMTAIMYSPLIHNAVEWGRAIPAVPGKVVTFRIYFEGNRAKNDPEIMTEAVMHGLVPIGHQAGMQDITSIASPDSIAAGRSWTAKVLGAVPGLFSRDAQQAVYRTIDSWGDFWHNTLLWDRVGDLQMGLYVNLRDSLVKKGNTPEAAASIAAHFANRYAGALPLEAMSNMSRKLANLAMFSRTYTLGNLGAMKDMFTGLPRDVQAQVLRSGGAQQLKGIKSLAARKAVSIFLIDVALFYASNSILQSAVAYIAGRQDLSEIEKGYADRLHALMAKVGSPSQLLNPFADLEQLSATSENEPGRENRVLVGYDRNGTAIYARNPAGKIGEEFVNWTSSPIKTGISKMSTFLKPTYQTITNDAGFGRQVYDPEAKGFTGMIKNLGSIVQLYFEDQIPVDSLKSAYNALKGTGQEIDAYKTIGPMAGVTFSKGATGGPALGELYNLRRQDDAKKAAAMPAIIQKIKDGDITGARAGMKALNIPPRLQLYYIRVTRNPKLRFNTRTNRALIQNASPEDRARINDLRGGQ